MSSRKSSRTSVQTSFYDEDKNLSSRKLTKKATQQFWKEVESSLPLPEVPEDYEIPSDYPKSVVVIPAYRSLKQNLYRAPLEKPRFDEDDAFVCSCNLLKGGCNFSCQNRMIYT
jgi:hypothetical protein